MRHVAIGLFCLGVSVYLSGKNKRLKILDFLFKNMFTNLACTEKQVRTVLTCLKLL